MGQDGEPQDDRQYGWEQDAPTVSLAAHHGGPLGSLHDRQRRWPPFGRVLWWALLLPLAIFAWSSWRLRGVLRVGGYLAAGWVLLFGVLVVAVLAAAPSAGTVPVAVEQSSPASAVSAAGPAAAPLAAAPPPVVAMAAPAPPRSVAPAPRTVRPAAPARTRATPTAPRAATPPASGSSRGNTYTNVDGNQIQRPVAAAAQPAGATAKCKDGTWSFSQHHSGTCSGHGGVAQFL
jgi:uncharacterized protein DUF3761